MAFIRLDKMLAHLGYGSRKEVKSLIRDGYVAINGEWVYDDDLKVDPQSDEITVNEQTLHYEEFVYLIMNKPTGVLTATMDSHQSTVLDFITDYPGRHLFPVGRLDKDSEGLLLITNDGALGHYLLSPRHHVEKEYHVRLAKPLQPWAVEAFKKGIVLDGNEKCLPAQLIPLNINEASVIITEGKFHQVKRMFEQVQNEVVTLKRVRFHTLLLDPHLLPGHYRPLTLGEIAQLKTQI